MLDTPSTSDRCEIRQRSTPCPAAPVAVVVQRGSVHAHYFHVCAAHRARYVAAGWEVES